MGATVGGGARAELLADGGIPPAGVLSRTVHDDDDARVVLFGFAAGEELTEHTSSRPAVVHVLSGAFDMTMGGERIDGVPGTWVHMPPGTRHALRAREPSLMLLTLLRAPGRSG